jgi:hypothetical protein
MNLDKIIVGQKPHDKTDLGYVESSSQSVPKCSGCSKTNKGQSKKSANESDNMKGVKGNKEK